MSTILTLDQVEVRYNAIRALKGVSLSVNEGEIVSLIGANGSGKSTLLKAILGLESVFSGKINFDGAEISGQLTHKIVERGVALAPEGRGVFSEMTVLENLEMGAFLKKDKTYVRNKLDQMYAMFPILSDRRKQKAGSLSGGEQQMLAVARALMSSPRLLLLDEPGLGLAPLVIKSIFDTIVKINKEDKVTIFLVEQNAKTALSVADKGYVMETGSIVLEDTGANLLQNPKVKAAYLGE